MLRVARRWAAAPALQAEDRGRAQAIVAAPPAASGRIAVSYGVDQMPGPGDVATGGFVKFQRLAEALPNEPRSFNLLYLGSSSAPRDAARLMRAARQRRAKVVWNQNGVAYPGWYGRGWERANARMAVGLRDADVVFYQSAFCKLGADRYLGEPTGRSEVLYNAVDTSRFVPAEDVAGTGVLTLLLGGNQHHAYRVETAVRTLALVATQVDARLVVTGTLAWPGAGDRASAVVRQLADQLGVADRLVFTGPYRQADAPEILRGASLLLHTQENDACPNLVVEALASGLPVVYSDSGGVRELVGDEGGIGVPSASTWDEIIPSAPEAFAEAVLGVAASRATFSAAARDRAVERFDIQPWVARHVAVFQDLVGP